ncbi:hypothetical protein [Methylobacterium pseudosasicola]|uniref:Uncharacterized protein n=1 Tax=Methylobacterium pseudosasicola TaxID=582667 RepID=A0A1I4UQZ7_9HYPH|nr:hypothetical protein [Methylobacterium pseudosasicola]SFM91414.1 hypothetical protein SAMN05192568_107513 [Methylobacterium pseudosasicola]
MIVLMQIWALSAAVLLVGCLLRLHPVTVAIMLPPITCMFLVVRVLA